MTSEQEKRRDEILESMLDLVPEQHSEFLAQACGSDRELRNEVERLMGVRSKIGSAFLEPASHEPFVPELQPGKKLGRYEIEVLIGCGGMSFVYRARDAVIGRKVALKVLAVSGVDEAEIQRRFLAELRILGSLKHDNIVHVYDFGDLEGMPFIVMELLEGEDLARAIKGGRAGTAEQKVSIARQISEALRHIHDAGILHRDIKPANVFLNPSGRVKLMDFGISRSFGTGLQRSTAVAGTLEYMSPEQIRGEPSTQRTDIYSFGILLYELFTGQSPFSGRTIADMLRGILGEPVPKGLLRRSGVPAAVARLIRSATAKDPSARPPDFTSVLKMLPGATRSKEQVSMSPSAAVRPPELPMPDAAANASDKQSAPSSGPRSRLRPSLLPSANALLVRTLKKDTALRVRRHTVGRARERAELMSGLESVAAGRGLMLCVAGEAGIGKTTLIEDFLAESAAGGRCAVARGKCSERLSGTEAYLPLLEAVESLLRDATIPPNSLIQQIAPTWYTQVVPSAAGGEEASRVLMEGASVQRIKRELVALLHELSRPHPLVLFIDDLHWADVSTLDLLNFIASRFDTLRVLILVTYRPSEMLLQKHPFLQIERDLLTRGRCRKMALDFLSLTDVGSYVDLEFPGHAFPPEFPVLVHVRTEGSPLFMTDLLRYLRDRSVIEEAEHVWQLSVKLLDIDRDLPESVRGMIDRKIAQLSEDDVRLLSVASVQGYEFDSAVVAQVLNMTADEIEERLEQLERVYAFVRLVKEREFPDRRLSLRYRFVHVLYQNAFYDSLRATRKTTLSREVARVLEEFHGGQTASVANELAALYETGREYMRAAEFYGLAAHQVSQLCATQEAAALARRGLAMLEHLPEGSERNEREVTLQITLGNAVMATSGYAAPEVGQIYSRARVLCEQLGNTSHLLPTLHGLYTFHVTNGNLSEALEQGRVFLGVAEKSDPALIVAHRIIGCTLFCMGELRKAREHFEQLNLLYDPDRHRALTWQYSTDIGMIGRMWLARTLWLQGYPDQALCRSDEGVRLAREARHPNSLAYALDFAGWTHQYRRDWRAALQTADQAVALSTEQRLTMWLAWGINVRGAALFEKGDVGDGIAEMRRGLDLSHSIGSQVFRPEHCGLLAAAYVKAREPENCRAALEEAQTIINRTRERYWQAEIFRLQGELLAMTGAAFSEVESYFSKALDTARQQGARSLELRAAVSLARLSRRAEDLRTLYSWFTEGFDTPDLREAAAVLAELERH